MEQARLKLEERTVDQVAPREQQPESDQLPPGPPFLGSGILKDRQLSSWLKGWFSYKMRDKE